MTDPPPPAPKTRSRRLWLTIGEVIAVAGLALAALNYCDSHREVSDAEKSRAAAARGARVSVFILRGAADAGGKRVLLEPLNAGQAIQSQRYLFPKAVLGHAMAIDAGRPQIDLGWFDDGLRKALKHARKSGAKLSRGEAELPVGIVTTYVEAGETRTDASLYRLGYAVDTGFLGALKPRLQGLSLDRRGVPGDMQTAVDRAWAAQAPAADVQAGD